jgi:hypothetical protein
MRRAGTEFHFPWIKSQIVDAMYFVGLENQTGE